MVFCFLRFQGGVPDRFQQGDFRHPELPDGASFLQKGFECVMRKIRVVIERINGTVPKTAIAEVNRAIGNEGAEMVIPQFDDGASGERADSSVNVGCSGPAVNEQIGILFNLNKRGSLVIDDTLGLHNPGYGMRAIEKVVGVRDDNTGAVKLLHGNSLPFCGTP